MKRLFLIFALFCSSTFGMLFANEQGILFDVGALSSVVLKPYVYEQVSYNYKWDFGLVAGVDLRAMENILKNDGEAEVYFGVGPCIGYKCAYLSGGVLLNNRLQDEKVSFYVRGGYRGSLWQWGKGKGGLDIALEVSPTLYAAQAESDDASAAAAGSAIGTAFSSVFNLIKLNIGVTYFLPF